MAPQTISQIVLRVNSSSELGLMLHELIDKNGAAVSEAKLQKIGGKKRSPWLLRTLDGQFDNISVTHDELDNYKARYYNISSTPALQTAVATAVQAQSVIAQPDVASIDKLQWPDVPPLMDESDTFREPSWFRKMEKMVDAGKHIIIAGPPGVGKDTAIEQLAARRRVPLVTIGADAGLRKRDLIGTLQMTNGSSYIEVAEYAAAVVNGWWVSISEINAAEPDSLMLLNTQLAPPYIINIGGQTYRRHPDFRLFASYNPGLIGTKPLPQSLKDRFFPIKLSFHQRDQLKRILIANGMPDDGWMWTDKVLNFGMEMWNAHEQGRMRFQISTRRLIDAVTMLTTETTDDVRQALRDAVIDSIDSPIEAKVAEEVLTRVMMY
jgi:hypothetical protein